MAQETALCRLQVESLTQSFCALQRAKDAELADSAAKLAQAHVDVAALEGQARSLKEEKAAKAAELDRLQSEATANADCLKQAEMDRDTFRLEVRELTRELDRVSEVCIFCMAALI